MPFNIFNLTKEVISKSDQEIIEWCQGQGLIRTQMTCNRCGREMTLRFRETKNCRGYGEFRCQHRIKGKIRENTVSLLNGTWFEQIKIPIGKALLLTYCFSREFSYLQTKIETSWFDSRGEITSENTLSDWYNYCREICMSGLDRLYDRIGKIGGPGHVVEIDESKIGKRKYNVGRLVEGTWILGMIDLGTETNPNPEGAIRLEICPGNSRDGQTLLSLINKHVEKGTTIITDCWKGYDGLQNDNFEHLTVNHSYNFVNPDTYAHTQTIESNWRPIKKKLLKTGVRKENLSLHMCEFLWRREKKRQRIDEFDAILEEIRFFTQQD